jgi:predicted DNA-binding protein (UPF0278 family)
MSQQRGDLSENQKITLKIVRKLIFNRNSELLIAPISYNFYIIYNDMMVKIKDNQVEIINGKYFYDVSLPQGVIRELEHQIKNRLEVRIKMSEEEVTRKTKRSLNTILEELSDDTPKMPYTT